MPRVGGSNNTLLCLPVLEEGSPRSRRQRGGSEASLPGRWTLPCPWAPTPPSSVHTRRERPRMSPPPKDTGPVGSGSALMTSYDPNDPLKASCPNAVKFESGLQVMNLGGTQFRAVSKQNVSSWGQGAVSPAPGTNAPGTREVEESRRPRRAGPHREPGLRAPAASRDVVVRGIHKDTDRVCAQTKQNHRQATRQDRLILAAGLTHRPCLDPGCSRRRRGALRPPVPEVPAPGRTQAQHSPDPVPPTSARRSVPGCPRQSPDLTAQARAWQSGCRTTTGVLVLLVEGPQEARARFLRLALVTWRELRQAGPDSHTQTAAST